MGGVFLGQVYMADRTRAPPPRCHHHHHPTANMACPVAAKSRSSKVGSLEASALFHNSLPSEPHVNIELHLPGAGREGGTFPCIRFPKGV